EGDLKPSDKVRERFLDAVEDRPEYANSLLGLMPDSPSAHDRLYKLLQDEVYEEGSTWRETLHDWLKHNSRYFLDELVESVRSSSDAGSSLQSLARLDWDQARPLVESLATANRPDLTPIALMLLYEHACQTVDSTEAGNFRSRLKAIAADRNAGVSTRIEAITSLANTDWEEQQEWLVSHLADPTRNKFHEDNNSTDPNSARSAAALVKRANQMESDSSMEFSEDMDSSQESLIWRAMYSRQEKWFPTVRDLIGHPTPNVHNGSVIWLLQYLTNTKDKKRKVETAQTLLPWLLDKRWAEKTPRDDFIQTLVNLKMPEALPGLIHVLETDEKVETRAGAADALKKYRDPRAIPALRRALEREKDERNRAGFITALALSGGFSEDEMAAALETYLRLQLSHDGGNRIAEAMDGESDKALPLEVSIGRALEENEEFSATEGVALRLIERARALRAKQPDLAERMLNILKDSRLPVVEADLVKRIGEGWVDIDWLKIALKMRNSLQQHVGDELYKLYSQGGSAAGIAAVILNDRGRQKDVLEGKDAKSQLALLASARYLRDQLPVETVGKLLASSNLELAKAAQSYLEIEDSRQARNLILARHPGEAQILGYMGEGTHRVALTMTVTRLLNYQ